MNKTWEQLTIQKYSLHCLKALLFGATTFYVTTFYGCGKSTKPDTSPPKVDVKTEGPYSVTDTVRITFNEDIDTTQLVLSSTNGKFSHEFENKKTLLLFGDTISLGQPYFHVDNNLTVELTNLSDSKGNQREEPFFVDVSFVPWLDGDYSIESSLQNSYIDTLVHIDRQEWYNETSIQDTLITEGMIWENFIGHTDNHDYKALYITPQVASGKNLFISFHAIGNDEFRIFAIGPFKTNSFNLTEVENALFSEKATPEGNWDLLRWADSTSQKNAVVSNTLTLNLTDYNQLVSPDGLSNERAFLILRIESKNDHAGFYQLHTQFQTP